MWGGNCTSTVYQGELEPNRHSCNVHLCLCMCMYEGVQKGVCVCYSVSSSIVSQSIVTDLVLALSRVTKYRLD